MLEPEQEQLLVEMVEAARQVPRHQQAWHRDVGSGTTGLYGPWGSRKVLSNDVSVLKKRGYLHCTQANYISGYDYVLTPAAHAYYATLRERQGAPGERIENEARHFLASDEFCVRYPEAYERWAEAEALLWAANSANELSTIGHKVRESTQKFASALAEHYEPPGIDPDVTKVKRRVGAVVNLVRPKLGDRRAALIMAMADYWEACIDVIQRQEHGDQKGGGPLTWSDGRRVVFHTAALTFEIAATLEEVAPFSLA